MFSLPFTSLFELLPEPGPVEVGTIIRKIVQAIVYKSAPGFVCQVANILLNPEKIRLTLPALASNLSSQSS